MLSFSLHEIYLLLISVLIGVAIGIEREYHNKSAGLRTIMLVAVGSCIFTMLSVKIGVGSYDRIAANIVTGIGFLGAGVIFKDENRVSGLTTASTVWITAALGMAVGANCIWLSIAGTVIVLLVLWLLIFLERFIEKINTIRRYKITCLNSTEKYSHYEKIFNSCHLRYARLSQYKSNEFWTGNWKLSGTEKQHEKLAKLLLNDSNIQNLEF